MASAALVHVIEWSFGHRAQALRSLCSVLERARKTAPTKPATVMQGSTLIIIKTNEWLYVGISIGNPVPRLWHHPASAPYQGGCVAVVGICAACGFSFVDTSRHARKIRRRLIMMLSRTHTRLPRVLARGLALKDRSQQLTGDPSKAPHQPGSWVKMSMARSNLRATGWKDEDFKKPIITVGAPWTNANPVR